MCYAAIGIAAVMLLLFLLDAAVGIPFSGNTGSFLVADIFGILASGVVGFLGYNALQEVK